MTDRELTRKALLAAIAWQHCLAEGAGKDTGLARAAELLAGQFREMLRRKYGESADNGADVSRIRHEKKSVVAGAPLIDSARLDRMPE